MSTSESTSASSASGAPLASVPMKTAGIAAWVVGSVLTAIGTFFDLTGNDSGDESDELVYWLILVVVLAAITYAVYRYWFTPAAAADEAPNSALIAGIVAAVTVLAFWTGLPAVFGFGAILLGLRSSGPKAKIGLALGVLAVAGACWAAIVG